MPVQSTAIRGNQVRLSRIQISNYSRVRDLSIEVRGHAVIVGANDVGKTSILRLLNYALGATTAQIYQGLSVCDLADPSKLLVVEVEMAGLAEPEWTVMPHEPTIDPTDGSETLRVRLEVGVDPDDPDSITVRRWFPDSGHDRAPTREQLLAFRWRYLPATRGASATQLDGPSSGLQLLLKAADLGSEQVKLTELLDTFNATLGASTTLEGLRSSVASHLSKAMPRDVSASDLSIRTAVDPADSVLQNVSMFFERDGDHVPLAEQSDGIRQLLLMTLFDLAQGTANMVAIDEPELHLHPSSQRTVAELFTSASNQKILVTHSPYIVQRFDPSQVIAITPDGISHQIAADKLSAVQKVQAHWWSPRLLEALTARQVVVVEGVSDRILVEAVARAIGMGLDRCGVVVFELDGADKFPNVYRLLGPDGFHIPVVGLVDDKEQGKWLGAFGGKPKNVVGSQLWISTPDIEDEYCRGIGSAKVAKILIDAGVCQEADVLQACNVSDLAAVPPEPLATFCRNRKVAASVAISEALDSTSARSITSVHSLLSTLRAALQ
jgi:putative ATP-dependent endonuclease of OLD family